MSVHFQCPQGHRLRADDRAAGAEVNCPVCKECVVIPHPASSALTDTGVIRILESCEPDDDCETKTREKTCPRCGGHMPVAASVCRQCQLYQFPTADTWRGMLHQAMLYLVGQRRFGRAGLRGGRKPR
jgi:hypothetical protein